MMYKRFIPSIAYIGLAIIWLTSCNISDKSSNNLSLNDDTTNLSLSIYTALPDETALNSTDNIDQSTSKVLYDILYPIYLNGYVEYMAPNGEIVTDYKFDKGGFMYEEMAIVCKDNYYGTIDRLGSLVVSPQYAEMSNYSCGLALTKNSEGYYGYIDTSGNVAIPFEYDEARSFSENIAIVSKENKVYFIDTNGNIISEKDFLYFSPFYWDDFHDGLAVNGNSYYDVNGECKIEDNVNVEFAEGYYPGGFYDGLAVYPQIKEEYFEKYYETDEQIQQFFSGSNWYDIYIDKNGEDAFNKRFEWAGRFSEGLASAEIDGKIGCIDLNGNFVYYNEGLRPFFYYSDDRIEFTKNDKFGFLDRLGNVAVEPIYNNITNSFINGIALVEDDNNFYYINLDGDIIVSFEKTNSIFICFG